jgi:hypothetical protein
MEWDWVKYHLDQIQQEKGKRGMKLIEGKKRAK